MVAELSHSRREAVLALPAFGGVRPERQAKELVVQLIAELLEPEGTSSNRGTRQPPAPGAMPLRRTTPPDDDIDLRLTTTAGGWRLLTGMVRVNRPWRLVFGLRSALAAALATAAFGVVTSSVWQLAGAISVPRLCLATAIALATIVIWLIVDHDLWQRVPSDRPDLARHVRLYNTATVLTLPRVRARRFR